MAKVELKKPIVEEISANIADAQGVVLVNYSGLTVAQDTQLRKELREAGVVYKVYKNTMMNFAFQGTPCEELCKHLDGTNALAISKEDATAPARILAKFAKTAPQLELKHCPKYLPERNFLENCLEASSPQSPTLLASSARSQKQKKHKFLSEGKLKAQPEVRNLAVRQRKAMSNFLAA